LLYNESDHPLTSILILFVNDRVKRAFGITFKAIAMPLLVVNKLLSLIEGCLKAAGLAESLASYLCSLVLPFLKLLLLVEGTHHLF
jgi:hypothetical protein